MDAMTIGAVVIEEWSDTFLEDLLRLCLPRSNVTQVDWRSHILC
jgi:hypothetical protein